MKPHYHHDFVGVFITALEVALIFHAIRFVAARAAVSDNRMVSTAGAAVGGAFTFSGSH
jgi:hypothetical protein